jgi:hypothetical protein
MSDGTEHEAGHPEHGPPRRPEPLRLPAQDDAGQDEHDRVEPARGSATARPGGVSRRTMLLGGAVVAAAAVGVGIKLAGDEPQAPSAGPRPGPHPPTNRSTPSGDDETRQLQALLDKGTGKVVFPEGTHVISSTLVVPWNVDTVELPAGCVLHMRGNEIALRRSGRVEDNVRTVQQATEGDTAVTLDASGLAVGGWVYLCADDWVKKGKSKVGMLRRVTAVTDSGIEVDKPLIRSLTKDARALAVELAPAFTLTGKGAIENGDPHETTSNLVRLDFVQDIEVSGIELRNCGTAALRTFGTVGGLIDCYIHDCLDVPGHYGYGVSCSSATRDLEVRGVIERVRHAFTTDHGYDPPHKAMEVTGEPEDIRVSPVVRDTTSTGIDTHEPGYGITIVPDVTNCGTNKWGGMNIRARNVTVEGGTLRDSKEWGILVSPSASGTVIRNVRIEGIAKGDGIHCKADTQIEGGTISGFRESNGVNIDADVTVTMTDTAIDGEGASGARGIALAGTDCSLSGTVTGCSIGVLHLPGAARNSLDLSFQQVAREEVTSK